MGSPTHFSPYQSRKCQTLGVLRQSRRITFGLYGRCARGERCRASIPHGHWQSSTFTAALRHDRITAPMLLDGPMDGNSFVEYIKQVLSPELKEGDMVICDNLSSHKVAGVREAIESRGAELIFSTGQQP